MLVYFIMKMMVRLRFKDLSVFFSFRDNLIVFLLIFKVMVNYEFIYLIFKDIEFRCFSIEMFLKKIQGYFVIVRNEFLIRLFFGFFVRLIWIVQLDIQVIFLRDVISIILINLILVSFCIIYKFVLFFLGLFLVFVSFLFLLFFLRNDFSVLNINLFKEISSNINLFIFLLLFF